MESESQKFQQPSEIHLTSEQRLNIALAIADFGVWEWDMVDNAVYWDERMKRHFGCDQRPFDGSVEDYSARLHPDDRDSLWSLVQRSIEQHEEFEAEHRVVWPDGSIHWIFSRGAAIYDPQDRPIKLLGGVLDITSRKEAEQELAVAKKRAEEASRAKSLFPANMSHEIRTPLGAMLGFADLALEKTHDKEASEYLKTVIRNGQQLYRIIDEILDLSKVEADKLEIQKTKFALSEVIHDVTSLLEFKAREKGLEFKVRSIGSLPETVQTDPVRLRQILMNIIGNAVKFTEKGHVDVILEVLGTLPAEKPCLSVTVSDTGPGIRADQISRLFQPFSQADATNSRKYGGTGLGLYLSKRLCQALGGDLSIKESAEQVGCTFHATVELEITKDPQVFEIPANGSSNSKNAGSETITEKLNGVSILVTDDSPDNLLLLQKYLRAAEAEQVVTAQNGEEALKLCSETTFDVVLMDIQMPGLDGYEVVRLMRERGYRYPILAVTAHAMSGERERCIGAGFDGYLVKPVNRAELIAEIRLHAQEPTHLSH